MSREALWATAHGVSRSHRRKCSQCYQQKKYGWSPQAGLPAPQPSATSPSSSGHVGLNPHAGAEMPWDPWRKQWRRSGKREGVLTWLSKQLKTLESPLFAPWADKAGFRGRGHNCAKCTCSGRLQSPPVPQLCWLHVCSALIPTEQDPPSTAQPKAATSMGLSWGHQPSDFSPPGSWGCSLAVNYFLPGKSHGRRSLVGCSPWGREESDTTERLHFHFSLLCIGEGNGNLLQCSCLENPRDRGAWWAALYGVT